MNTQNTESGVGNPAENKATELSSSEATAFIRFISKTHLINTDEEFKQWCMNDLRHFFDFGMLVCATGRLFGEIVVLDELHGIGCPANFIEQVARRIDLEERWVIRRWLKNREPQLIDSSKSTQISELERWEFEEFQLGQIAAHGCITPDGLQASYFSFSRFPDSLPHNIESKIRMAVPHLHQVRAQIAWKALKASGGTHTASRLSPKELEVLRWILQGKTNAQIATLLKRSAQTVKHQVASVLEKLDAHNRAQAVAKALHLGILSTVQG